MEVISEDLYCEIIHDYKAGMTMREIADELHIGFATVWRVCFEAEKLWKLNDGKRRLKKQRRNYEK
nr:helix-turn-helix domain-containing protein [Oscillospiraceae bacterium]